MKINLIVIGKLDSKFKVIFNQYWKKINFFATLKVIELKEFNTKNITLQIKKETQAILQAIPKNSKPLLCSLRGKDIDSLTFANYFEEDNLTFIIGGSHGVDERQFGQKIKFSSLTMPHQFFRVMLIEQIFRALAIKNNLPYHK